MRSRIVFALTLLLTLVASSLIGPAHAVVPVNVGRPMSAQTRALWTQGLTGVYHVPPITCESSTACVLDFVGNGALQGYWMAKRTDGSKWIRLTKVAGWDNTYAAPITCPDEDSCVQVFYWPYDGGVGPYWMARQDAGTTWVRETLIPGTATKQAAGPTAITPPVLGASGWRYRTGNICVLDQTAGRVPGGLAQAVTAWDQSAYLNLHLRTNCAGYSAAQTLPVTAYTRTYGDCQQAKVWTTGGYLKPGTITKAALAINTECGETALAFGLVLGLQRADSNDYGTVMGAAGLPTARDYDTVAAIYQGVAR